MTKDQIEALDALAAKAAPGGWGSGEGCCGPYIDFQAHEPECWGPNPTSDYDGREPVWLGGAVNPEGREWIVALHNAWPALRDAALASLTLKGETIPLRDVIAEFESDPEMAKHLNDARRAATLEQAAKVCDALAEVARAHSEGYRQADAAESCARAIRALRDQPTPDPAAAQEDREKGNDPGASSDSSSNKASVHPAAAHADMVSEEHFQRWWKNHAIHRRAKESSYMALMEDSYRNVAWAAWQAAFGMIPKAHRDERIERLEERAQYMRMKIFNERPRENWRAKAELSALEWAIPIVLRATGAAAAVTGTDALSKTEAQTK